MILLQIILLVLLILDCSMVPCCTCNGRNAICKRCVCACSGRPYTSCLLLKTDRCINQLRTGGTSASASGDPLMVNSNKNDDDGSDGTAHMLPGTNCASDPRYILDTSNTCTNFDSVPVTPSSICSPSASPSLDGSPRGMSCVLCGKAVKTVPALWQHINSVNISRGCSLHLLSFNILIVLFVPALLVDLLILLGDILVSVPWKALVNVVLVS